MIGTRWRNPPQACLADAYDMDRDEMAAKLARPLNDRLTPLADPPGMDNQRGMPMYGGNARNDRACLADAMDMTDDELARAVLPGLTKVQPDLCQSTPPEPRRAYDIIQDIRKAADAALLLTDVSGELDHGVAMVAAENLRRLVMELAR